MSVFRWLTVEETDEEASFKYILKPLFSLTVPTAKIIGCYIAFIPLILYVHYAIFFFNLLHLLHELR